MFIFMLLSGVVQQVLSLAQSISSFGAMNQLQKRTEERHDGFMKELERQQKKNAEDNKSLVNSLKTAPHICAQNALMGSFGNKKTNCLQQNCSSSEAQPGIFYNCHQNEMRQPIDLIVGNLNWNYGCSGRTEHAA